MDTVPHTIRRALISVSDKTGIVDLARSLQMLGIQIVSTGGTASLLRGSGVEVVDVAEVTGFPEIMDGRVKTLHPKIHGGLLGVLDNKEHQEAMSTHAIDSIDLLIVNLYPFEATLRKEGVAHEDLVENIDIGGPAMIRAGAKNYLYTVVIVDPTRYHELLAHLTIDGGVSDEFRLRCAADAFAHTAYYDSLVAGYLGRTLGTDYPETLTIGARKVMGLRYGENPHQSAALYGNFPHFFTPLHGKELSYNNILDVDASTRLCAEFTEPTVVIVKHNNPCGVGSGPSLSLAYHKAFATDTVSPFGGIIAVNQEVDIDFAQTVHSLFSEVIIAPSFTGDALDLLRKKKDRRLLSWSIDAYKANQGLDIRSVAGSLLIQSVDADLYDRSAMKVVTERCPTDQEWLALYYAWTVAKHVKSNAIVFAAADRTLAIGAGQMSRLDSAKIAVQKAQAGQIELRGSSVASEAFFPFADGLIELADAGATAVIQPGGSVRDQEVIDAANQRGIAMVFTGMRHFRH